MLKRFFLVSIIAFASLFVKAQTADELFTAKEYVKAVHAYTDLIKTDSTNVTYLRRLGFCYLNIESGNLMAIQYFESALKYDAKDVASNYYLGTIYKEAYARSADPYKKKNKESAVKYLSTAAKLGSDDAKQELENLK